MSSPHTTGESQFYRSQGKIAFLRFGHFNSRIGFQCQLIIKPIRDTIRIRQDFPLTTNRKPIRIPLSCFRRFGCRRLLRSQYKSSIRTNRQRTIQTFSPPTPLWNFNCLPLTTAAATTTAAVASQGRRRRRNFGKDLGGIEPPTPMQSHVPFANRNFLRIPPPSIRRRNNKDKERHEQKNDLRLYPFRKRNHQPRLDYQEL